jgi:polyphosphate glucokinase
MEALGLDIGGTGIKGAPVDSQSGELLAERFRLLTPQPATPQAVADTVAAVAAHFNWQGPIGCGFPAVIRAGIAHTAANVDAAWIGTDARELFSQATGCQCAVANDADVAGLAEMRFGAGQGRAGVVLVVTLGTGIGSALFSSGQLVPNTELGHIELEGMEAEQWAAESAREREELSWKKWAKRVDQFLQRMQDYFWPDLIIVGGGVSKKHQKFLPLLKVATEVVPARLRNEAGIVGGALAVAEEMR